MTTRMRLAVLVFSIAGTAFPQQSATKMQATATERRADQSGSSKAAPQSSAKGATSGAFRGRFFMSIGASGRLSDSKMMFQDVATCRSYEFTRAAGSGGSFSTEGFFVVTGTVIGKQLRAASSKVVGDDTEVERLRSMQSKCKVPE